MCNKKNKIIDFYKWQHANDNNIFSWLLNVLTFLILWNIWKSCNKAKFNNSTMDASNIIDMVWSQASHIYHAFKLLLIKGKVSYERLQFFNFPFAVKYSDIQLIHWKRPILPFVKLNVVGASKGNTGEPGARGIFRDHNGNMILTFSSILGQFSSFFAEAKAICWV